MTARQEDIVSEPAAGRSADDADHEADREVRPAPPGYGAATGAAPGTNPPPQVAPPGPADPPPAPTGGSPYYGRVPRFGAPASSPPPPPAAEPSPAAPPPAPWPPPVPQTSVPQAPVPSVPAGPYGPVPGAPWGPTAPGPSWSPVPPPPVGTGPASYAPRRHDYAPWLRRVLALVVDHLPSYVASALLLASYVPLYAALFRGDLTARPTWGLYTAGLLLSLAALGFTVWNRWVLAGRTGQSLGKRLTHVWLVGELDGRPVGVLTAFVRDLLHVLDSGSHVGYLWPLWDDQHQTLADKVAQTVVVTTPVPPLPRDPRG